MIAWIFLDDDSIELDISDHSTFDLQSPRILFKVTLHPCHVQSSELIPQIDTYTEQHAYIGTRLALLRTHKDYSAEPR